MMGFRGCLRAPSPAGDSHRPGESSCLWGFAASGTASVVPTFSSSCSNASCDIRPSGKNWFAPKIKAQPYPTVQQPLPALPCTTCGGSPGPGVLCLWDGKEEAWKSLPVPPVPTHCLSGGVQACRLPADTEGKLLPCLPTTFCCSVPDLCLCPRTALAKGIPHMAPWQLEDVSRARTCLAQGVPAAHPWTTSVPAARGRWGRQVSPPCQAVTASVTPPKANVWEVPRVLGDVWGKKGALSPGVSLHRQLKQGCVLVPASPAPASSDPSCSDPERAGWPWPCHSPWFGDFMELSALCWAPFPSCLSS